MDTKIYCGAKGSFSVGGVLFKPGQALSRKALASISSRNIERHLESGVLVMKSPEIETNTPTHIRDPQKLDPVKKWNINPASLVGKDIQQLNIMVLEREPTMTPFETIEEAAAQLTRDFKGTI